MNLYVHLPVIQFQTVDDFIGDIAHGRTSAIYYDLAPAPGFVTHRAQTIIRSAVIRDEGGLDHVASLTVRHPLLFHESGKYVEDQRQKEFNTQNHNYLLAKLRERLPEIGYMEEVLRPGLFSIPDSIALVYVEIL